MKTRVLTNPSVIAFTAPFFIRDNDRKETPVNILRTVYSHEESYSAMQSNKLLMHTKWGTLRHITMNEKVGYGPMPVI